MNIAVNTRLLLKNKLEGIGWFSYETLKHIVKTHPEHNFYFIFDRNYDSSFIFADNVKPIVAGPATRHPFLWWFWLKFVIPRVLKKVNADIFLSTDGFVSLNTKTPQVVVIHDINFYHNPQQLPFWVRKFYNKFFPKFAKKAKHIGTVSEYSKKDLINVFKIAPEKITVCYNASNDIYKPITESEKIKVKEKYTEEQDFFHFVGALTPRKNIPGLLKSFDLFKENSKLPHKLIIVGSAMHLTGEIDKTYKEMKFSKDVVFTGRLNIDELHLIYASSTALVYIPFFEGFGIPLVEAMYSEIPIISGNTTSLPEVVGNAAIICDPNNHKEVAQHMENIALNSELRQDLIEKGKIQRQKFSWEKSGERLWECVEKAIQASNHA